MTDGFNIIQNACKKLSKRYRINANKLLEERISIELLNSNISNMQDVRLDNGAPLLLDFKALEINFDFEEVKEDKKFKNNSFFTMEVNSS